jgi:drug/metabolite transporter (DMT)-like permease
MERMARATAPSAFGGSGVYGFALAVTSAVLFGASTPASKLLLEELTPFQLAGLLYLGAALGMAPVTYLQRGREDVVPLGRANRDRLVGAIVLGGIIGPVLLLLGLQLITAGSTSLLLNLEMAATAVLGVWVFHEHLGRAGWLGVGGTIAAGVLISFEGGWPGLAAGILIAGACLCWGLDNHLTALIDGLSPSRCTLWKGLIAGATNLLIGVVLAPLESGVGVLLAALAVGALSYGASITLYISSAQQIGATRAQAVFASAPFVGAGLAFGILSEPFAAVHGVAGGVLIVSIVLLFVSQHSHRHVHDGLEHIHNHSHDDGHHLHEHAGIAPSTRHTHWHRHDRDVHGHPHLPDLHHRHEH